MINIKKFISVTISIMLLISAMPIKSFSLVPSNVSNYNLNSFGKITSASFYSPDTIVVNIQDLHNNREVQNNIFKLLTSLNKHHRNLEVYLEGASGVVDYGKLADALGENNADVLMNSLYDNDKISGAEYFGYKNNKVLMPIEQKYIYNRNIRNYSILINGRQEINKLLLDKYINIKSLDKYLTREQKNTLRVYNAYLNKKISSEKFYDKLEKELNKRKISMAAYINTKLYTDILKENKKINQKSAERQLQSLLMQLKDNISFQEYTNLLKDSNNLTDINVIFAYLAANINPEDKFIKYPDLFKLINLRELASLIDPLELVSEEKQLVENLLLSYSKYFVNRDAVFINLFFQIYKKLLNANINSKEYEYYKISKQKFYEVYSQYLNSTFSELSFYERTAEEFNELNLQRNSLFVKNILSDIKPAKSSSGDGLNKYFNINAILNSITKAKNIKVVISGGFHTEGVNKLLEDNKISYITITPNVKETDSSYEQNYLNSIVMQSDIKTNAISKMPFLEQTSPMVVANDIAASLSAYRESGKSWQEITQIINGIISSQSMDKSIEFMFFDNEAMFKVLSLEGKEYLLSYKDGKVSIETEGTNPSTAFATNIKTMVKEALADSIFRTHIIKDVDNSLQDYILAAIKHLDQEDLLGLKLQKIIVQHMFSFDIPDRRIYQNEHKWIADVLSEKQMNDVEVVIGAMPALIGRQADEYGDFEEYGCLAYLSDKKLYIHSELLDYLQDSFSAIPEKDREFEFKNFFKNLLIHEQLERVALGRKNPVFNAYLEKKGLTNRTKTFHDFIQDPAFEVFAGMSVSDISKQRALMKHLDAVISRVNYKRSEYGAIIDLNEDISDKDEKSKNWLSIRAGDQKTIERYARILADKVYDTVMKYNTESGQKSFDKRYFIAYRHSGSDNYMKKIIEIMSEELRNKIMFDNPEEDIDINVVEINKKPDGTYSFYDDETLNGKKVLLVDDIVSKKSDTFKKIYDMFKQSGYNIQPCAFFDLSQETEDENLSDTVYEYILNNTREFKDVIIGVDGKIEKYAVYWLVRLINEQPEKFKDLISVGKNISAEEKNKMKEVRNNLIKTLYAFIENGDIRDVQKSDILYILLSLIKGEPFDISNIEDVKNIIKHPYLKELFKSDETTAGKSLTLNFYSWQDKLPLAVLYASLKGFNVLNMSYMHNISAEDMKTIAAYSKEFKMAFLDEKSKAKYKFDFTITRTGFKNVINELNKALQSVRSKKDFSSTEYADNVKDIMSKAVDITLELVKDAYNIDIDKSLFEVVVAGSLTKGNMMKDSDIYYDIITSDPDVSIIIDEKFAPIYSAVLGDIGLEGYSVSKYSSTTLSRENIGTVKDERDVVPFLDYEPLTDRQKETDLYKKYIIESFKKACHDKQNISPSIHMLTDMYLSVVRDGSGWIGNSFVQSNDDKESFDIRYTLIAFESVLKEIIFDYISGLDEDSEEFRNIDLLSIRGSVAEQLQFIRNNIVSSNSEEEKNQFEKAVNSWGVLSDMRHIKKKNTWVKSDSKEINARQDIIDFVSAVQKGKGLANIDEVKSEVSGYAGFLSIIESFVFANATDMKSLKKSYSKYNHIENLLVDIKKVDDIEQRAKILVLLSSFDEQTLDKLDDIAKSYKNKDEIMAYIHEIKEKLKIIREIEKFPPFADITGLRSLQNYWDNIIKTAAEPDTMMALFAHMMEKAKDEKDSLLLLNVYLPLVSRFGLLKGYEYMRNNLFVSTQPAEYLNIIRIINKLYGKDRNALIDEAAKTKDSFIAFLKNKGVADSELSNIDFKFRVKTPFSIYEKLTSNRKNETDKQKQERLEKLKILQSAELDEKMSAEQLISLFGTLSDLVGFHIVVGKKSSISDIELSKYLEEFLVSSEGMKVFVDDNKKSLQRIKYECEKEYGLGYLPVPVEMCVYTDRAYQEEMSGLYNPNKLEITDPHYIYKIGFSNIKGGYFNSVFVKNIEFSGMDDRDGGDSVEAEERTFVFVSDNVPITKNFVSNFNTIRNKLDKANKPITAFVRYGDKLYVVALPKNAVIFDIASQVSFDGDAIVSVYDDKGGFFNNGTTVKNNTLYLASDFESGEFDVEYGKISDNSLIRSKLLIARSSSKIKDKESLDKLKDKFTQMDLISYKDSSISLQQILLNHSDILDVSDYNAWIEDRSADLRQIVRFLSSIDEILQKDEINEQNCDEFIEKIKELRTKLKNLNCSKEFLKKLEFIDQAVESAKRFNATTTLVETLRRLNYQKSIKSEIKSVRKELEYLSLLGDNAELIKEFADLLEEIKRDRRFANLDVSNFLLTSVKLANHYGLKDVTEFFECISYKILSKSTEIDLDSFVQVQFDISQGAFEEMKVSVKTNATIADFYDLNERVFINGVSREEIEQVVRFLDANKTGEYKYTMVFNNYGTYDFYSNKKTLSEAVEEIFRQMSEIENLSNVLNKNNIVTKNPVQAMPLMSLGNNIEQLVRHAATYHFDMVSRILVETNTISEGQYVSQKELADAIDESPVLMTQILLGLYGQNSYDESQILSQETPLLSQEEVYTMKEKIASALLEAAISAEVSQIEIKVSRSLDLVESEDIYSFATFNISDEGMVMLYVSEALLKELYNQSPEQREYLLEQLILHEVKEYITLSSGEALTYAEFHEQIMKDKGQADLMNFIKSVVPDTLSQKNALFEETDTLLQSDDISMLEQKAAAAIICGSASVSSFEKAFDLYSEGKLKKIFVSGGTRNTVALIKNLRDLQRYGGTVSKNSNNLISINSVEEFLSLTDETFNEIKKGNVQINIGENLSEAAIIRWVILNYARQSGMSESQIARLEQDIVIETQATNTPENFRNIMKLTEFQEFVSSTGENVQIVVIQTPFSQVRAKATFNKELKDFVAKGMFKDKKIKSFNVSIGLSSQNYHYNNVRALTLSLGEWSRIIAYTLKGDIMPSFDDKEGLDAIPLEILKDLLSLLPVLNTEEKAKLFGVFNTVAVTEKDERFQSKENLLATLAVQLDINSNQYKLILDFITYLYSDTTEQRQLEKQWAKRSDAKGLQQQMAELVPAGQTDIMNAQIERTRRILTAA